MASTGTGTAKMTLWQAGQVALIAAVLLLGSKPGMSGGIGVVALGSKPSAMGGLGLVSTSVTSLGSKPNMSGGLGLGSKPRVDGGSAA